MKLSRSKSSSASSSSDTSIGGGGGGTGSCGSAAGVGLPPRPRPPRPLPRPPRLPPPADVVGLLASSNATSSSTNIDESLEYSYFSLNLSNQVLQL